MFKQAGAELCQAQINFQLAMKLRELNMKVDNEKEAVEKALKQITEKIDVKMH